MLKGQQLIIVDDGGSSRDFGKLGDFGHDKTHRLAALPEGNGAIRCVSSLAPRGGQVLSVHSIPTTGPSLRHRPG